jgi:hypothetical protein
MGWKEGRSDDPLLNLDHKDEGRTRGIRKSRVMEIKRNPWFAPYESLF